MKFNTSQSRIKTTTINEQEKLSNNPNTYGGNGSGWNSLGNMFLSTAQQEQQRQQRVKELEQEIRYKIAEIDYQRSTERERLAEEQRIAAQSKAQVEDDIDEVIANGGELSLYRYLKNRKVKDLSNYKMTLGGKIVYRQNKEQFGVDKVNTANVGSDSLFIGNDDGLGNRNSVNGQKVGNQVNVSEQMNVSKRLLDNSTKNVNMLDQGIDVNNKFVTSSNENDNIFRNADVSKLSMGTDINEKDFVKTNSDARETVRVSPVSDSDDLTEKTFNVAYDLEADGTEKTFPVTVSKYSGYSRRTKKENEVILTKEGHWYKVVNGVDTYMDEPPSSGTIFWWEDGRKNIAKPEHGWYYKKGDGGFNKDTYLDGFTEYKIGDYGFRMLNTESADDLKRRARIQEWADGMIRLRKPNLLIKVLKKIQEW